MSVVVVTAVVTNSNGVVTTSTSSSLSTSSATSTSTSSSSSSTSHAKTWGIVGGCAGGAVALIGILFIAYRLSQRRFSNLDHAGGQDEIKWPQLQMEGQMVAAGASTLRPMGTRRTGGAGVGDDEDDRSEWHSDQGHMRSTEHLNEQYAHLYQDGYMVGNDVYAGRPPPTPSVSGESSYGTVGAASMPAFPPAAATSPSGSHYPDYPPSSVSTAPPAFGQHAQHANFIQAYPRTSDQRGDSTFEFMTGASEIGHAPMTGTGLHRNLSAHSNTSNGGGGGANLYRADSSYSHQTALPPFSDGLSRAGSGYSQVTRQGAADLHRAGTGYSQASAYSQGGAFGNGAYSAPSPRMPGTGW